MTIPRGIGTLQGLEEIHLFPNPFVSLPSDLFDLPDDCINLDEFDEQITLESVKERGIFVLHQQEVSDTEASDSDEVMEQKRPPVSEEPAIAQRPMKRPAPLQTDERSFPLPPPRYNPNPKWSGKSIDDLLQGFQEANLSNKKMCQKEK
jgi:hypothetical protein